MDWKKYFGLLVLLIITAVFLIILLIMGAGNLITGDEQLFMALNPTFNPADPTIIDHFFVLFSTWGPLGWGIVTWGFIPFALALFFLSFKVEKLRPMRFIVILVVVGIGIGFFGITTILKFIVERTRPFMNGALFSSANDWVPVFYPGETVLTLFDEGLQSFPSGHATSAFIFATPFILIYKNYVIRAGAILFGILGAYARVFLGVHYPIDIFVGSMVGILTIWVLFILFRRYLLPKAPWFEYRAE